MKVEVKRYFDSGNETLGLLFINGKFYGYTVEDEERTVKVFGETRIPEGTYRMALRTEGGHHIRYKQKFPEIHKGMLHILDVPNFKWILIHIGNTDDDTAGCLIVGSYVYSNNAGVGGSTLKYKHIYPIIADAIEAGEEVEITYSKIYNN